MEESTYIQSITGENLALTDIVREREGDGDCRLLPFPKKLFLRKIWIFVVLERARKFLQI